MNQDIAGWLASFLTTTAAIMTAANLGARITGWGFAVFTLGALAWIALALMTGERSLLFTNIFLAAVNLFGVWRWLGRKAKYEKGSTVAACRSQAANVPSLFPAMGLAGLKVTGSDGETLGTAVDAMLHCEGADIAYVVIADGSIAGIGETLRAVEPGKLEFAYDGITAGFGRVEFLALPPLADGAWPSTGRGARVG